MKPKILILVCLLMAIRNLGIARDYNYSFGRPIEGVSNEWHRIVLPNDLFGRIRSDFNDIRILGLTVEGDTIEAPYILKHVKDKLIKREIQFRRINDSKRGYMYYFTFEIPGDDLINEIDLDFEKQNFDWKIRLEGSHDQEEWFELLNDYRILDIKNEQTDYRFTKLKFSNSRFRYCRMLIESESKPNLTSTSIWENQLEEGNRINFPVKKMFVHENKNQTFIDIALEQKVPISNLKIRTNNTYDYYRPFSIRYVVDSFETEKGWKYNYKFLGRGTLSSLEENEFTYESTILDNLQIVIQNQDNEPLNYLGCEIWGYQYVLIARFSEKARYYLTYGDPSARKPNYDINHFQDKIPSAIEEIKLGDPEIETAFEKDEKRPLFENKFWLWGVLIIIIILLGYFSLKMIRSS